MTPNVDQRFKLPCQGSLSSTASTKCSFSPRLTSSSISACPHLSSSVACGCVFCHSAATEDFGGAFNEHQENVLRSLLSDVASHADEAGGSPFQLSSAPTLQSCTFHRCRIVKRFASNARPYLLELFPQDSEQPPVKYILKEEDVSADVQAMRLLSALNQAWADEKLKVAGVPVQATTYDVHAIGEDAGLIEFVEQSVSLAQLKRDCGVGRRRRRVLKHIGEDAAAQLAACTAAHLALVYLLGVGDGHFDNLMLRNDGQLFRVDFGFIFGQRPFLDTPTVCVPRAVAYALCETGLWAEARAAAQSAFTAAFDTNCFHRLVREAGAELDMNVEAYLHELSAADFERKLRSPEASAAKTLKNAVHELAQRRLQGNLGRAATCTASAKTSPLGF